jgi:hypothetical protein
MLGLIYRVWSWWFREGIKLDLPAQVKEDLRSSLVRQDVPAVAQAFAHALEYTVLAETKLVFDTVLLELLSQFEQLPEDG